MKGGGRSCCAQTAVACTRGGGQSGFRGNHEDLYLLRIGGRTVSEANDEVKLERVSGDFDTGRLMEPFVWRFQALLPAIVLHWATRQQETYQAIWLMTECLADHTLRRFIFPIPEPGMS